MNKWRCNVGHHRRIHYYFRQRKKFRRIKAVGVNRAPCWSTLPVIPVEDTNSSSVGSNEMNEHCHWDSLATHEFLYLLSERVKNRHGTSFKSADYKEISNLLFTTLGRRYDVKQLSSKYQRLQKIYNSWRSLMQHTGFGWDHESQTPTCPVDIWQEYLKQNNMAKEFLNKGLPDKNLYEAIFEKQNATGRFAHTSASQPTNFSDNVDLDIDTDDFEPDTDRTTGEKRANMSACGRSVERKKKKKDKVQPMELSGVIGRLTDAIVEKSKGGNTSVQESQENTSAATDPFSMEKCYEILTSMQMDPMLLVKVVKYLVTNPQWREMFVRFKPEHKDAWIYYEFVKM